MTVPIEKGRVLECSRCGGPIGFRAPFCPYCKTPIHWTALPTIKPGALIYSRDYRTTPIPNKGPTSSVADHPEGKLITVGLPWRLGEYGIPARDTVTRVEAVVIDRGGAIGPMVRAFTDDALLSCYVASIVPGFRSFRLSRNVEGGEVSTLRPITEWEQCSAIRGLGEPNVVEIRCADSVLEVHINGEKVLAVVDSTLAFGASGFRIFSLEKKVRVLVKRLDVFEAVTDR